jgi:hypothetical protein
MADDGGFDPSAMIAAIDSMIHRVKDATEDASEEGADAIRNVARQNASQRPGPLVRTGNLVRSILADPPVQESDTRWVTQVAPHVVYGRIQELGGEITAHAGNLLTFMGTEGHWVRKRSVTLPPRPYLEPALEQSLGSVAKIVTQAWGDAISGS